LGFDILIDSKLKTWLLEVNHAPSFNSDTKVDQEVKEKLLVDTFNLLNIKVNDRDRVMRKEKKDMAERENQRRHKLEDAKEE
jgi:tubulin polyglutamylase TTLL6/13